jgi:hypothetical protein
MQFMTKHLRGLSVLVAVGFGFANAGAVAHALPEMPQVRYEINGPAVAQFIYYQTEAGQLRAINAPLPWSTEFTGFGGQVFVISAQGPGPISCKILLNGNVVSAATATTGVPARTVCTH